MNWDTFKCKDGEAGENCNDKVIELKGESYIDKQKIEPHQWKYYTLEVEGSFTFFVMSINEIDAPPVYGRILNFPTLSRYDLISTSKPINILDSVVIPFKKNNFVSENIFMNEKKDNTKIWYIGVYNPSNEVVDFITWSNSECPNNCSGNGQCENNICICTKKSDDYSCSLGDGFKLEYIILIVVGCCILVSVVIGVIVWLARRKQKQTYDSF